MRYLHRGSVVAAVLSASAMLVDGSRLGAVVAQPRPNPIVVAQTVEARKAEADRLFQQGNQQYEMSQFTAALQSWEASLNLYRELSDRDGEGNALMNLGNAYWSLSQYDKAISYCQQALSLFQQVKNRNGEANILMNLGNAYWSLSQYDKAISYCQQALSLFQQVKNRNGEANILMNLGVAYGSLSQYDKAISYYQQALPLFQQVKNRNGEANILMNLGVAYGSLSQYDKAVSYYQQALPLFQQVKDRNGEATTLTSLGIAYRSLLQYNKAIEFYQQALPILQSVGDQNGEALVLMNLGIAYADLSQYNKAIGYYQQALPIYRVVRNRNGEALVLMNSGIAHDYLSQSNQAIEFFQQALPIFRAVQDRDGEGKLLNNIGVFLKKQKQPELAIVFYKQSVNVSETIRTGIRKLDRALQDSYTQSVAGTYRSLADLLIQQGRIAEAQQVLELLKVQELNDLDPAQRTNPTRLAELALNPLEQEIQTKHNNLIAFGAKVRACEQNCQPLEAQLEQLRADLKTYTANIQAALEKAQLKGDLVRIDDRNKDFIASASKIVNAQPGTVLIYPLVLPDKIHLLWASQGGILSSATCPMGEKQLNTTIANFQRALVDRTDLAGVKQHGKILYDCLIKPLEEKGEWDKNKIQNLVIAADRTINYIPIGALYNGKQFLVERYTISNILNAGLTDVDTKLPANPTILGLGISDSLDGLPSLPNVQIELNTIIRSSDSPTGLYPGSLNLNQTATLARFRSQLAQNPYNIVHIATHGQFIPTKPDDSFLLFSSGKPSIGDRLTINRIQQQDDLRKVHLVVLSACQTASGQSSTSGIEIQGLSAAFVRDRAKAVIASLWQVNDASTSLLMQQFYKNLATGKLTKSEALRQAQLSLLNQNTATTTKPDRSDIEPISSNQPSRGAQVSPGYSHPYYWAPFILIGNGL